MILETVLPVFLIILVSYIFGRVRRINTEPLVALIIYVTAPCLAFYSTALTEFVWNDFFVLIFSATAVVVGAWIASYLIFRSFNLKFRGFYLPIMFMNSSYMGYPMALLAFGIVGLSKAVIYNIMTTILIFTVGIYIANRKSGIREMLHQPVIYALIPAVLFSIFGVKAPDMIMKPIILVGDVTVPLSLIVLGFTLASIRIKSFKLAIIGSVLRFLLGFGIAFGFCYVFGVTGVTRNIIMLLSVMPSAFMSFVISKQYKSEEDIVASTVLISTIMSVAVIPLVLYLIT